MHAIEIENLAKCFRLGNPNERGYKTLRDSVTSWTNKLFKRQHTANEDKNLLWALRDVSFTVNDGEALGIVGRNGSGKSTLLKILSRITEPTQGCIRLHGRVASLLEVGTGFHPELTGRENIFLNGAILGMTRAEIRKNFDLIVTFAEIEKFLDTPVKRYSSGMYVRLAFAVAAHLTPEILIVDEVLAVGDHQFQKKCLGQMSSVARSGRTVLFVSHNLAAVEHLCSRSILLSRGQLQQIGPSKEVLSHYLSSLQGSANVWDLSQCLQREGSGSAQITQLQLLNADGNKELVQLNFGESFRIRIHYHAKERIHHPTFGLVFLTQQDERVFMSHTPDIDFSIPELYGEGYYDCLVQSPNLLPNVYMLEVWIHDVRHTTVCDQLRGVGRIEIGVGDWREGNATSLALPERGYVYLKCQWIPK